MRNRLRVKWIGDNNKVGEDLGTRIEAAASR